jgi:hypothetical protein
MTCNIPNIQWNVVVNLGIKCNILSVSREAKVRYFSSPFDNMDTVEGLVESSQLMASKFSNYWDDKSKWEVINEYAPKSTEIRNKIVYHKDTSKVYYPHFADVWFKDTLSKDQLNEWKKGHELSIDPIWCDFKRVFKNRQDRMTALLESDNNILFVRSDEPRQLKRAHSTNQQKHLDQFITNLHSQYGSKVGLMYLYCNNKKFQRQLKLSEWIYTECVAETSDVRDITLKRLQSLNISKRSALEPYYFDRECNNTE